MEHRNRQFARKSTTPRSLNTTNRRSRDVVGRRAQRPREQIPIEQDQQDGQHQNPINLEWQVLYSADSEYRLVRRSTRNSSTRSRHGSSQQVEPPMYMPTALPRHTSHRDNNPNNTNSTNIPSNNVNNTDNSRQ